MAETTTASTIPVDRFRLLVESVTDYAIYMLDPEGIISSWNSGARRFKGYEAEEIIGQHFSQFYTEEARRERLPQRALDIAAREGRFEGEGWRVRKDGSQFWTHVVIDSIRDPSGKLLGFAKITRDLTERREAELALRRSQEQFRLLVQGVTDYAIYMLSPDGHVASWNSGAARIKQYSAEEIIGQHFSKFYTEEDRQNGEPERALSVAREHGRFEKEGRRVRKDGTRFWAHVVIDAVRGDNGEIIGFAKVTRDITERKQAERELETARETFFQAQKMEAIGQLSGGVAHDFNNLLFAILGSLELLRKRVADDARAVQLLDTAVEGAKRGAALTQRMLAFARRQDLSVEPVNVSILLVGIIDLIKRTLGPAVTLETDLPRAVRPAMTDANQLELAIINLAVNARDAMPLGGEIRIGIAEMSLEAPAAGFLPVGDYVRLTLTDSGEGMDEATTLRATEPFFTTKGIGKGTGLGLSMVKGFVEQTGGGLKIESQPGKGTKVELWLPIAAGASAANESALVPAPTDSVVTVEKPPCLTILVVDDDALILMNTTAMLEDLGHTVIEAPSGASALDILDAAKVDLIITDHAMPRMNGTELAGKVRARMPSLPIVLATGYAELPAGSDVGLPRLAKPFTQADLRHVIAKALGTD